jgi:hypothetical protein
MNPARKISLWIVAVALIIAGGITAAINPVVGIIVTCGSISISCYLLMDMIRPANGVEAA